jgi:hypothetical protein
MINNHIFEPNEDFDFSKLSLGQPAAIQGGSYFTKLLYDKHPFYIQTPKGFTRGGFIKNGKKIHVDLMFDSADKDFIKWLENLESQCQELIYEKGDAWFENKLEKVDIENAFTSPMKIYRSGQNYLVRASVRVNSVTNTPNVKIYNETETSLTIEDITNETNVVSIIEILGIKFTARNFQIDIELKQSMVTSNDDLFSNCLIRPKKNVEFQVKNENENKQDTPVVSEPTEQHETNIELLERLSNSILKEETSDNLDNSETDVMLQADEGNSDVEVEIVDVCDVNDSEEGLREIDFDELDLNVDSLESVSLKKPNQVYYEMYKNAREKAKEMKAQCITAFLEAKNIKNTYMLEDIDTDSDDDTDFDEY